MEDFVRFAPNSGVSTRLQQEPSSSMYISAIDQKIRRKATMAWFQHGEIINVSS